MATRSDELLEDYKSAISSVRKHMKMVLLLTFIGAIVAGSEGGFKSAKRLIEWFFGEPKVRDFARWYPVAIGLYCLFVWVAYFHRLTLRKVVIDALKSESRNEALRYRLSDDLFGSACPPRWFSCAQMFRRGGQFFLLATPLISMVLMKIGLEKWNPEASKAVTSWSEHIWIGGLVLCGILVCATQTFRVDLASGRDAEAVLKPIANESPVAITENNVTAKA